MYEFSTYLWVLYGISALGLVFVSWLLFNKIKIGWMADGLILLTTVFLLTPWLAVEDKFDLAPALVILLSESLLLENGSILRAGMPLLGVYGLVVFVLMLKRQLFRGSAKPAIKPEETSEQKVR